MLANSPKTCLPLKPAIIDVVFKYLGTKGYQPGDTSELRPALEDLLRLRSAVEGITTSNFAA